MSVASQGHLCDLATWFSEPLKILTAYCLEVREQPLDRRHKLPI
jgi:hypothetical protein